MKNFKVEVSKDSKKYTFVLKANLESELRDKLHKDGYSILTIQEIGNIEVSGKAFYFEVIISGQEKKGIINGDDIFKAYVKLKDDLGYKVKYIYDKQDLPEIEKIKIINILEKQYETYKINKEKETNKKELKKENLKKENKIENKEDFYLKKELDETYKLIEFILKKLKNIIDGKIDENISLEEKEKLQNIYNNIIKIKTSTNIAKLKEIGELSLKKIGEIELRVLERKKTKELELILKETNKLLKKVGSKTYFVEKDKDLVYLSKDIFNKIKSYFTKNSDDNKKKAKEYDKNSYYYLKNISLLNRYKELKKLHKKEFFQNFLKFIFFFTKKNKEYIQTYFIKSKVIDQNIKLLELKLKDEYFSYTKVINAYEKYLKSLISIFENIKKPIFYFVFLYSLFFILFLIINYIFSTSYNINSMSIKYLILSILLYFFFEFSKSMKSIVFNFLLFFIIFIFFQVNF